MGVFIFEGMKVGFLPGDFQTGMDSTGKMDSKAILSTANNVLPIWLRIARDNLELSKAASKKIEKNWENAGDSEKKELLITELETSMQVFVSCGIALDALYDQLRPYAKISQEDINRWRNNKTARSKQIVEIIRRIYKLGKKPLLQFRKFISEILKFRDLAVHPSLELKNSCTRPDLSVSVDWKFSAYRYSNSYECFTGTTKMLDYLHSKQCDDKNVNENIDNIFKALWELKIIENEQG